MSKELYYRIIRILIVLFIFVGMTFLYKEKNIEYSMNMKYLSGRNNLGLVEYTSGINLEEAYPVSDEVGSLNEGHKFSINNDIDYRFNIYLTGNDAQDSLPNYDIRYMILKNGVVFVDATTLADNGFLFSDNGTSEDVYELKLWISDEAGFEILGKQFSGKVTLL